MTSLIAYHIILIFTISNLWATPVMRIVSLKPNITEILFELGVGDSIVGVTEFCNYPDRAKMIPRVADYTRPFLEPLVALKPDLVISSKEESSKRAIENIERLGITVRLFSFSTLEETLASIQAISVLVGHSKDGNIIVKRMRSAIGDLRKKWSGQENIKTLIVWGHKPLVVGGKSTFMDDLLPIIGAENVVRGQLRYPKWSLENVIAANPDVIIDLSMGSEANEKDRWKIWSKLKTVKAVHNGKVYFLDNSLYSRASPRIVDSMEKLGELIHKAVRSTAYSVRRIQRTE